MAYFYWFCQFFNWVIVFFKLVSKNLNVIHKITNSEALPSSCNVLLKLALNALLSPRCASLACNCCLCSSCFCNSFCWWCLHWHLGRRPRDLFMDPNTSEGLVKLVPNMVVSLVAILGQIRLTPFSLNLYGRSVTSKTWTLQSTLKNLNSTSQFT